MSPQNKQEGNDRPPDSNLPRSTRIYGLSLLLLGSILLALGLESIKALDQTKEVGWQTAIVARAVFGMLFIVPMVWPHRRHLELFHPVILTRSVSLCLYYVGVCYAVSRVSPADVTTIMGTRPIWVAFIVMFAFGVRFSYLFWIATVVIMAGMVMMVGFQLDQNWHVLLWVVVAVIFSALGYFLTDKVSHVPPTVLATHLTLVLLILSFAVYFGSGGHKHIGNLFDAKGIALLMAVGLCGTLFQMCLVKSIQIIGPVLGGLAGLMAAVSAYILDLIFWENTEFNLVRLTGLLLVLIPSVWIGTSRHVQREQHHWE